MKKSYPELFLFPIFFALVMIATFQSVLAQTTSYKFKKATLKQTAILCNFKKYRKNSDKLNNIWGKSIQNDYFSKEISDAQKVFLKSAMEVKNNF